MQYSTTKVQYRNTLFTCCISDFRQSDLADRWKPAQSRCPIALRTCLMSLQVLQYVISQFLSAVQNPFWWLTGLTDWLDWLTLSWYIKSIRDHNNWYIIAFLLPRTVHFVNWRVYIFSVAKDIYHLSYVTIIPRWSFLLYYNILHWCHDKSFLKGGWEMLLQPVLLVVPHYFFWCPFFIFEFRVVRRRTEDILLICSLYVNRRTW